MYIYIYIYIYICVYIYIYLFIEREIYLSLSLSLSLSLYICIYIYIYIYVYTHAWTLKETTLLLCPALPLDSPGSCCIKVVIRYSYYICVDCCFLLFFVVSSSPAVSQPGSRCIRIIVNLGYNLFYKMELIIRLNLVIYSYYIKLRLLSYNRELIIRSARRCRSARRSPGRSMSHIYIYIYIYIYIFFLFVFAGHKPRMSGKIRSEEE